MFQILYDIDVIFLIQVRLAPCFLNKNAHFGLETPVSTRLAMCVLKFAILKPAISN